MELKRHPDNPVLLPIPDSTWECSNVFNPGVIHHNGLFHMFYRAQGLDWISRIGYAVSSDGVHWNRMRNPLLEPTNKDETRGIEDPRITEIDGTFYMTYTAYGTIYHGTGESPYLRGGVTPMIARSSNLITWDRIGPIVKGEDNKDHVLFPEKIAGKFTAFHRRRPDIWLATSLDLFNWPESGMFRVFGPSEENEWESSKVGANGPPIKTDHGWLVLYHATDHKNVYRFGVCLLDLENPTRVLHRSPVPIFEPLELWEIKGDVPNVVFSCANVLVGGTIYVFYAGGDHVIGLAYCELNDLIAYVMGSI